MHLENKNEKLSSEYWTLHRNSLLFSSALFISCQITDASDFKILDLKLGAMGAGAVVFLLLLASVYAFISLFLEWRDSPYAIYNLRRQAYSDFLTALEKAVASTYSYAHRLGDFETALKEAKKYQKDFVDAKLYPQMPLNQYEQQLNKCVSLLTDLNGNLNKLPRSISMTKPHAVAARFADWLRLIGLGILVPAAAFFIAFAHAFSRLWWPGAPTSWIMPFLASLK